MASILVICFSCAKDEITYEKVVDDPMADFTDSNGFFILHPNSISYFNSKENRVYSSLFKTVNDRELISLHSFQVNKESKVGIITLEKEKRIEFINPNNFVSLGYIDIRDEPRDIAIDTENSYELNRYALVTTGRDTGNVMIINYITQRILYRLKTGANPGKIFINDLIYILNSGDSTVSVINREFDHYKVIDTIVVGFYPIDIIQTTSYSYAAILCNGRNGESSIVIYDLLQRKIFEKYYFDTPDFKPTKLIKVSLTDNTAEFIANNMLYRANLKNLSERSTLSNLKITDIIYDRLAIAISHTLINGKNQLYLLEKENYELSDSLQIDGLPHEIVHF